MFSRVSPFCRFALAALALAAVVPVSAQLAAKSPFQPPQAAATNTPTAGAPLEFRAYMETNDGVQFRIYDPAKKIGTWIKLNEKNSDFDVVAKQHDDGQQTLTIEHQGKTLTLAQRTAKVVSSGMASMPMPPPVAIAPSNVSPAVTQAVVLNPTPADEQRRLDAVAAEVARRRALREQASADINRGVAPNVAVPQVDQARTLPARNFQAVPQGNPQPQGDNPRNRGPAPNTDYRQR